MIRSTLLAEGNSDRALLPILNWLLAQVSSAPCAAVVWADFGAAGKPPTLSARISAAIDLFPCDLLFVHRDADKQPADWRYQEINAAQGGATPLVCVVPIRTQEAWLLLDEGALRRAAGRPSGRNPLDLPPIARIEALGDPKGTLHDALRAAGELSGRRAAQFRAHDAAERLADLVQDWAPLRQLSAFRRLEMDLQAALSELGGRGGEG